MTYTCSHGETTAPCELCFRKIPDAFMLAHAELIRATTKYPPFNSAHEGHSTLREEFEELWDEVKIKQGSRDLEKMKHEAVQTAAMALRFIIDICNEEKCQK